MYVCGRIFAYVENQSSVQMSDITVNEIKFNGIPKRWLWRNIHHFMERLPGIWQLSKLALLYQMK